MKLLLHICCAPCLIGSKLAIENYAEVSGENIDITCYWYNINIHPFTEYRERLETAEEYASQNRIKLIVHDEYGLVPFTKNVINDLDNRCGVCYDLRLQQAAKYATDNAFDAFSTTLLVSPYQNQEYLRELGEKHALKYNTRFFYADFRNTFREGQKIARENKLYMQKYCGCIFSEQERYVK